jgi:hypothetical protein
MSYGLFTIQRILTYVALFNLFNRMSSTHRHVHRSIAPFTERERQRERETHTHMRSGSTRSLILYTYSSMCVRVRVCVCVLFIRLRLWACVFAETALESSSFPTAQKKRFRQTATKFSREPQACLRGDREVRPANTVTHSSLAHSNLPRKSSRECSCSVYAGAGAGEGLQA